MAETDKLIALLNDDNQTELEIFYSQPRWQLNIDFYQVYNCIKDESNSSMITMMGILYETGYCNTIQKDRSIAKKYYAHAQRCLNGYAIYRSAKIKNNTYSCFQNLLEDLDKGFGCMHTYYDLRTYYKKDGKTYTEYLLLAARDGHIGAYVEASNLLYMKHNYKDAFKYFELAEKCGIKLNLTDDQHYIYDIFKQKNSYESKYNDLLVQQEMIIKELNMFKQNRVGVNGGSCEYVNDIRPITLN